jgi:carbonic anhydrase
MSVTDEYLSNLREIPMSVTNEFLSNNAAYASSFKGPLPLPPGKHVAVVACMDARLDVYRMLGISEGEAHVFRNAGGVITDDGIRSLAISQRLLGTKEIIVIHHTDCGMLTFTDDEFKRAIQDETGIKPSWAAESFGDLEEEVRQSMRRIEASPFVTKHESLRGFIFDVATGKLNEVTLSTPQVGRQHDRSNGQVQSSV